LALTVPSTIAPGRIEDCARAGREPLDALPSRERGGEDEAAFPPGARGREGFVAVSAPRLRRPNCALRPFN
jgi:hypothetical protein